MHQFQNPIHGMHASTKGQTVSRIASSRLPLSLCPPEETKAGFQKGDKVIMTGWEMGQKFHGGHAEFASVKVGPGRDGRTRVSGPNGGVRGRTVVEDEDMAPSAYRWPCM